jgi:hypothetical protein
MVCVAHTHPEGEVVGQVEKVCHPGPAIRQVALEPQDLGALHLRRYAAAHVLEHLVLCALPTTSADEMQCAHTHTHTRTHTRTRTRTRTRDGECVRVALMSSASWVARWSSHTMMLWSSSWGCSLAPPLPPGGVTLTGRPSSSTTTLWVTHHIHTHQRHSQRSRERRGEVQRAGGVEGDAAHLAGLHTGVLQRTTHCTAHGIPHLCARGRRVGTLRTRRNHGSTAWRGEESTSWCSHLSRTVGRGAGGLRDGAA